MTRTTPIIPALLIIATGLGFGLAGCSSMTPGSGTRGTGFNTTTHADTNTPQTWSETATTDTEPSGSRTSNNNMVDPFWIETAAQTDRPHWQIQASALHDFTTPTNSGPGEGGAAERPTTRAAGIASTLDDGLEGLTHVTFAAEGADIDPCISHDGTFMVYASTQHRPTADIYLKTITGRTVTQLTADPAQDVMPAVSPDGQRVAFTSNRTGNWDIFVMSTTGGQAVQFTNDPAHDVHPTWSPDGARLVFCRLGQISNRWEIWVSEVSGSGAAEFLTYGLFPRWCPRSGTGEGGRDKILFQRSRERGDRAFSIWTVDYKPGDASSATEIASARNAALINASWSPDGARIVYSTIMNPNTQTGAAWPGYQSADLWITEMDGTGRVNLTSGRFMNLMPCWGADNRIYFVSDRGGVNNIWSVGTDKAIMAATGHAPAAVKSDVANAPEEPAAEH